MNNKIKRLTIEEFNNAPIGTKFCESFGSNYQFFRLVKNASGGVCGTINEWDYNSNCWNTTTIAENIENYIDKIEFQMF